jgi:hypothetical protein
MTGINKLICIILFTGLVFQGAKGQPVLHDQTITVTNFIVYEKDATLFVEWATDGAVPTNYWQVQVSDDGIQFSTFAVVLGPDPRQQGDRYQYMEKIKKGRDATKYYRLRHVDVNGNEQISKILTPAK